MKPYFFLLAILFASTLYKTATHVLAGLPPMVLGLELLMLPLFALCLLAAYARAFERRFFSAGVWRLIWMGTLGLGVVRIGVMGLGYSGAPINQLELFMIGVIHGLFAVPAIHYERQMLNKG